MERLKNCMKDHISICIGRMTTPLMEDVVARVFIHEPEAIKRLTDFAIENYELHLGFQEMMEMNSIDYWSCYIKKSSYNALRSLATELCLEELFLMLNEFEYETIAFDFPEKYASISNEFRTKNYAKEKNHG